MTASDVLAIVALCLAVLVLFDVPAKAAHRWYARHPANQAKDEDTL